MAIPTVGSYRMPRRSDLPRGNLGWKVDEGRCVLLIHDMQRYFLAPFVRGGSPLSMLIANIAALRDLCVSRGIPVLYSVQRGGQPPAERGLLHDFWGPGMNDDPSATEVIEALAPSVRDTIIRKSRYSAFFGTDLLEALRAKGRGQLIICGVYGHIGCLATAMDAFMNDIQPFLVADAVADFSAEHHCAAIRQAAQVCARVCSSEEIQDALGGPRLSGTRGRTPSGASGHPSSSCSLDPE